MKIAMWSGPRNLSTAMMYSFASRSDCEVMDEPFYAAYLAATGLDHPMREEILASQDTNPRVIAERCASPVNSNAPVRYMKHMAHHMADGFPLDWAQSCANVFLIRHPARVIASYVAKRQTVTLHDIGIVQQLRLFRTLGGVVIDSFDIRADPDLMLRRLCDAVSLTYEPAMLSWPIGGNAKDGVWASHWYGAVHNSTGFAGSEAELPRLSDAAADVLAEAMPAYDEMAACRI